MQGQGSALALPLTWIEQRLAESGLTIKKLVQSENQQQAADQVSISNSIGSLRFLGSTNWRDFVESMSAVETVLREDPVYRVAPRSYHQLLPGTQSPRPDQLCRSGPGITGRRCIASRVRQFVRADRDPPRTADDSLLAPASLFGRDSALDVSSAGRRWRHNRRSFL